MWLCLLSLLSYGYASPFVTTWVTTTTNESITLPIQIDATFSVFVDWGDGHTDNFTSFKTVMHRFINPGEQRISVFGTVKHFQFFGPTEDNAKLISVDQWGDHFIIDKNSMLMFWGCRNLSSIPTSGQPYFSGPAASLKSMFLGCERLNTPIAWDLTNVTNLESTFQDCKSLNSSIQFFNTSQVTTLTALFSGAKIFNGPLFLDDTRQVTTTNSMFSGASAFNQSLNFLNTKKVYDMSAMFQNAVAFNQPLYLDTSSVFNFNSMFAGASSFNQPINFTTSAVSLVSNMFARATAFNSPLFFSSTSKIFDTSTMFQQASSFNQSLWFFNTEHVTSMELMFDLATSFNQPLSHFNTTSVINMKDMFRGVPLFDQDLTSWNADWVQECEDFCLHCGLPAFRLCTPCANKFLSARGIPVCDCPPGEVQISFKQCARNTDIVTTPAPTPVLVNDETFELLTNLVLWGFGGGFAVLLTIIIFLRACKHNGRAEYLNLLMPYFASFDVTLDMLAVGTMWVQGSDSLASASFACVIVPVCISIVVMVVLMKYELQRPEFNAWFKKHRRFACVMLFICCANPGAVSSLACGVGNFEIFSAPFSPYIIAKLRLSGVASLLLEDIPQLLIQVIFTSQHPAHLSMIVLVSMGMSAFMIVLGLVDRFLGHEQYKAEERADYHQMSS